MLIGVVFNLFNRICLLKKSEETFCKRNRYTKSLTATLSIQCKQIIKTVVLNEKLILNIRTMSHEETVGIQPISMASRTDNAFSFCIFVPII